MHCICVIGAKAAIHKIIMPEPSSIAFMSPRHFLLGLIAIGGIGLVSTIIVYFWPHGDIAHQWGTLLVLGSMAAMLFAALALYFSALPRGLATTLQILIALDILGTGICAYFLEFYLLLGLMVLAVISLVMRGLSAPETVVQP